MARSRRRPSRASRAARRPPPPVADATSRGGPRARRPRAAVATESRRSVDRAPSRRAPLGGFAGLAASPTLTRALQARYRCAGFRGRDRLPCGPSPVDEVELGPTGATGSGLFVAADGSNRGVASLLPSRRAAARSVRAPSSNGARACRRSSSSSARDARRSARVKSPDLISSPAAARRVPARVHADAEEAELGAAQGRARAAHQRQRGHRLHPGRRPQPAGALGRARPRRPREGSAGRPLPHRARHARHDGRRRTATRAARSTAPSDRSNVRAARTDRARVAAAARERDRMPRRRDVPKRETLPDPKYSDRHGRTLHQRA